MTRRSLAAMVTVALTVGLVAPVSAETRSPDRTSTTPPELPDTRSALSQAERDLARAASAIERAGRDLGDAQQAVQRAATRLSEVERQLADAQEAQVVAAALERETAAAAGQANELLALTVTEHATSRTRLEQRAVQVFKTGPGMPEATLLRGLAGSSDWHEVVLTMEAVSRIVRRDSALVETTGELTRDLVTTRADAVETRHAAVRAARHTARETRRVEQLHDRQQQALAELEQQAGALAAKVADLEQDVALKTALVQHLEAQVARLELAASTVLVPVVANLAHDGPPPPWAHRLPAAGRPWAATIDAIAASRGVDGRLMAALVWTESGFRPGAVSHAGAMGMAQLMPGTAAGLGVDPWDPTHNIDGGTRYLRTQLQRFDRVDLALAAYNAGPNRVERAGPGIPDIVETQLYVVRVIDRYQMLAAD